jgi:hypothetical protein
MKTPVADMMMLASCFETPVDFEQLPAVSGGRLAHLGQFVPSFWVDFRSPFLNHVLLV